MAKSKQRSTKTRAWIDARLRSCRLVSEAVTSVPAQISDGIARNVRINATTQTGINVGLNHTETPTEMQIEIEYSVILKLEETGKELANYSGKHAAQFRIADSVGVETWAKPPEEAMASLILTMQLLALRRAEATFIEMSFKGVNLPNPILEKEGVALLVSNPPKLESK